jgi:PAS domain S-box-containing protein
LFASEERFHRLVDAVTDYAIFMLDPAGHVETWNTGARRIKGYEADEIIGKHFSIFYPAEDRACGKADGNLERVLCEGHLEEESWRVRKDGSRFWASVAITALRSQNGEVTGFAKVTRDLTSKREAEENARKLGREQVARSVSEAERERLLTLLRQVPAIVNFVRGPDLVWEFVHPRAIDRMGGRDVTGKPLLVACQERCEKQYYDRIRCVYETGETLTEHEVPIWHAVRGRAIESYWTCAFLPVRDASGHIEGVMTFELDVTATVQARRQLERVSEANERAREELEKLNRAKDEFLATMSHELRTPLNAIYGWATILRKNPADTTKVGRGLEIIERNAEAQTRLVSDLLDVSRIISGKLKLQIRKADLSPVIHEAAEVVRPAAEAKGVRLIVDVDPEVGATLADRDRLHQVMWNLLINAVRFTPRGGRIMVNADRTDSGIVIRVQDTGAGIASEHLPHIFERFRQVDSSTTRSHGGLGLGLAIVRHLVESHGGTVQAESEGIGRGTTFTVRVPVRPLSETAECESGSRIGGEALATCGDAAPARTLQDVRVLAVDDDSDSLELVRVVLEGAGASVTTAHSAGAALEALELRGPFEIIVSDIGMPEMDGYALMRRVRARAIGADVPAIALTAYARAEDAELARRAGYQEHLTKPVDHAQLLAAVRTWSQSRGERARA